MAADKKSKYDKSKYTSRGAPGAGTGDVFEEEDRREAVPEPPQPPRSFANIMAEARGSPATTRPPPREQAQQELHSEPARPIRDDPVPTDMTDEEANGRTSVSLCTGSPGSPGSPGNRGNHRRLVCHWSLRDPSNTNQSWRLNEIDYIDDERTAREHRRCLRRRPAELRQMLAERVFEDLLRRFNHQRRRSGATTTTPPSFPRIREEVSVLVIRWSNSQSILGRSFHDMHASKSTVPPRSAQETQEEKKEEKRRPEEWWNKMKRHQEEHEKVKADRTKREEARRKAKEAPPKNLAPELTRDLSSPLPPAAKTPVKTPKKTAQDAKKSEIKSAEGETTRRTRATAARPIVESETSSDYSDSVKPPQPSKKEKAAAKLAEEASAKETEETPAKETEETPAKSTEEAPAKPTTSAKSTASAKSIETTPAKPEPKASVAIKKPSVKLADYLAKKKAAKTSTATATADAEAEAAIKTAAEPREGQEPRNSTKKIEIKESTITKHSSPEEDEIIQEHTTHVVSTETQAHHTLPPPSPERKKSEIEENTTTRQSSPEGEIVEEHETQVISTETQTHDTPPPPSQEHQPKDNADVEATFCQPHSPGSPGKRKRSAAEEEPSPNSDARSRRSDALSPKEDVPSPRKKCKTPLVSPDPPPSPSVAAPVASPPPSSASSSSKKRKMVWAEEEVSMTITSPGGTKSVKRARSDDRKDGEVLKPAAPAEEEEPADAETEALFHSGSEEDGHPGLSVLTAGGEASSPSAQAEEHPAETEEEESTNAGTENFFPNSSEDDGNTADDEASDP